MSGEALFHVEVKGTSMAVPAFYLTRNEFEQAHVLETWRLAMVTLAVENSTPQVLTVQEMDERFGFEPLVWRCSPRSAGELLGND